jgi:GTP-binding protein Era
MPSIESSIPFRAGFLALVGPPNVGKSTLLNRLLGEKIAIATPRPQTTRNRILGVRNLPGAQLVLIDTPGLHRPSGRGRTPLNRFMVGEALEALKAVDAVVILVECPSAEDVREEFRSTVRSPRHFEIDPKSRYVLEEVKLAKKPALLAINKIDRLRDKRLLLPFLEGWQAAHPFLAIVPISAQEGTGVEALLAEMEKALPLGKPLFSEELLTDRAERFLGAELIREQVFLLTKKEVPYSTAVTIDSWRERPVDTRRPADVMVDATIHVEKETHKRIVVGEGGRMVREIGSRARHEISRLLGCPVHLRLFVRVDEDWTGDPAKLRELGYE